MNDVKPVVDLGHIRGKFEPISIAMGDQKVTNAATTGAEYLISTDMSCLMHIDGCNKHKGAGLKSAASG